MKREPGAREEVRVDEGAGVTGRLRRRGKGGASALELGGEGFAESLVVAGLPRTHRGRAINRHSLGGLDVLRVVRHCDGQYCKGTL